jgi:hypothetical protein
MTNHAVLSSTGFFVPQRVEAGGTLIDIMQTALDNGITHVWTNVDFPDFPGHKDKCKIDGWDLLVQRKGTRLKSITGWIPGKASVSVIFIRNSRWAQGRNDNIWGKVCTPKQLLTTVANLEKRLEVAIGASPGGTGWNLLTKFHGEWVKNAPTVDLMRMYLFAGIKGSSRDLIFQKPFTEGKYIHKVDRNSAYLYSTTFDLFFGVGNPVHDPDGSKADGKAPGAWLCNVFPTDESLPDYKAGTYWLATSIINLMRYMKYEVEVVHGNYWPKENAHQSFSKWSKVLWDARQFFPPDSFERQAIKQIAVGTVGLASYGAFEEDEDTDKRRPDIKCLTVARTYELMMHSILKFRRQTGLNPLMCYMDALYYTSDSPSPDFLAPLLVKQNDLGGFKYEGCIEITEDIKDILGSKSALFDKLSMLNKEGWSK